MNKRKCEQFGDLITGWVWGDDLSEKDRRRLGRHLLRCPSCRRDVVITRQIHERAQNAPAVEVPDWVMRETTEKIETTIRGLQHQWRKKRTVARRRLLWAPIAAMAAFVVISLWAAIDRHWAKEEAKTAPVVAHVPDSATRGPEISPEWQQFLGKQFKWENDFAAAETPGEALRLLREFLDEAKARPERQPAEFQRIIALCDDLVARWPDGRGSVESRRLIHDCYTALGESEKAREAFLAYAQAMGERRRKQTLRGGSDEKAAQHAAKELAASVVHEQGCSLFRDKDYLEASYYFETVCKTHPNAAKSEWARYMLGRVYGALNRPSEAIATYRQVLERTRDEILLRQTYRELSMELFNSGRKDEAIRAVDEMAERISSDAGKGYALYRAGVLQYTRGEAFYPDAIARLKKLVESYPEDKYAQAARKLMAQMNARAIGDLRLE